MLYYLNYSLDHQLHTKSVLRIKSVVIGLHILNLTFFPSSLLVAILCSAAPECEYHR